MEDASTFFYIEKEDDGNDYNIFINIQESVFYICYCCLIIDCVLFVANGSIEIVNGHNEIFNL